MTNGHGELVWFARKEAHTSAFRVPNALASSFCFVPLRKSLFVFLLQAPLAVAHCTPVRPSSDGQWALRASGWAGCLQAKLGRWAEATGPPAAMRKAWRQAATIFSGLGSRRAGQTRASQGRPVREG